MSIAVNCLNDITTKVQSIASVAQKTFSIYSEEDLLDKTKMLKLPCVGVMYEGIVADGGDPSRQGMSAEVRVALVIVIDGKSVGNIDLKNDAANLLDDVRKAIRMTRSPSQHKWRFISETPIGLVGNVLIYVQRWSTMTPLTS